MFRFSLLRLMLAVACLSAGLACMRSGWPWLDTENLSQMNGFQLLLCPIAVGLLVVSPVILFGIGKR